ncbi:MAG TPA: hypothetical protein VJT31_38795, partial [Rugosimonospora sp.]|nr:hypothetical protein [Rugosimonospora sp.]
LMAQGIHKAPTDGLRAAAAITDRSGGYAGAVRAAFEEYRANREYVYGLEKRWPEEPFWRHRLGSHRLGLTHGRTGLPDPAGR